MKGKKIKYNKIKSELDSIKRQHEIDLFGESLPEESMPRLTLKHPIEILSEVVMSVRENELIQIECEENMANLSREQDKERTAVIEALKELYENCGVCFDLPNIDKEEDKLFVCKLPEHEVKGIIKFPCCTTEKIVVYKNSSGHGAIKCPRCGRFSVFNFDEMTAETVDEKRGIHRTTN